MYSQVRRLPCVPSSFLAMSQTAIGCGLELRMTQSWKSKIRQANAHERLTIATLYDSKPWDAKWLQNSYHLSMKTLPENWQTMTDENEKQAILDLLSADANGVKP